MEWGVKPRDELDRMVMERLRRRFRTQYGVLSTEQAYADGASAVQIRAQLAAGEWQRLHRGIYRHAAAPAGPEQATLSACLAAGPQAVASHQSAAWLWGLIPHPPDLPTITVPAPAHPQVEGIRLYRSSDLDLIRVLERRRIPCTDPLRTLVDLACQTDGVSLDDAIDRALASQLVTVPGVVAELGRLAKRGRPGVRALRGALRRRGLVGAPHPSVLESRTARAFRAFGVYLPEPEFTAGPDGEYRLDYAVPDARIALEVDGYVWHFSPEHKRRDEARRRRLVLDGWRPLIYTWVDVVRQPAVMVREYLTAVGQQAGR